MAIPKDKPKPPAVVIPTRPLDEFEWNSLRVYLLLWAIAVTGVSVMIHREHTFISPVYEAFLLLPMVLALVWRANTFAVITFLMVALLQSGIVYRELGIIRLHVDSPQQFYDILLAGMMVFYLATQYGLNTFLSERLPKRGITEVLRLAFTGKPAPVLTATKPPLGILESIFQTVAFFPLWPVVAFWLWWGIQSVAATAMALAFKGLSRRETLPWTVMLLVTTIWVIGLAAAIACIILYQWGSRHRSAAEARAELIDMFWREHRRELDHQAKKLAAATKRQTLFKR